MMRAECDGEPWTSERILGGVRLLLIAGIDTTWSAIGASLWHLASHPEDRQRLAREPELIPTAVEEFLRAYSPVTMAREVAADTEVAGCPMQAGQMVLLPFPAANRDPEVFDDPDTVRRVWQMLDRAEYKRRQAPPGVKISSRAFGRDRRCITSPT